MPEETEFFIYNKKTVDKIQGRLRDLDVMWWALTLLASFSIGYLLVGPILERVLS